jgi:PAS domain S-box-containing protein
VSPSRSSTGAAVAATKRPVGPPDPPGLGPAGEGQLAVLDAAPNAILAVDRAGLITYANPASIAMFGYARELLVGQSIELLVPGRARRHHTGVRKGFTAHPVARPLGIGLDLAGRRSDGLEFPVEISLTTVGSGTGMLTYATVIDISARKAGESALAASERRFRTVLETAPNAIVAVAENGTIAYANPRVAEVFGYDPEELVGQSLTILLPERVRDRHDAHRDRFHKHPGARPMGIGLDLAGRRKDGREFPVEISLSPVQTTDGMQVFAIVVDITARKAAEAQLLQSQKLESVGRLAGGVAHDFNNLLFAINGYAELLLEDMQPGAAPLDLDQARHSVTVIQQAADRGANLTLQLLAFSRQQVVSPRVVDPAMGLHALEPMLRRLIGENITLTVRVSEPVGRMRIDPGQLDQIVVNLVVNARDAMPDGGAVTIDLATRTFEDEYTMEHFDLTAGTYVMLSIADTGRGIDPETREHIFEPFFTTKGPGQGTGLGLATIYGIVRQSGGHIWLYSEPGHGAIFKLYFPVVEDAASPATVPKPARPVSGTGHVLLVEDEAMVREVTRTILQRAGYAVTAAEDGPSAIRKIETMAQPIDVLVTDVVMPGMSGVDLVEWVMEHRPGVGIVMLSGYTADTLDLERVLTRGARFVTKPVASRELLVAVGEALTTARAVRS